MHFSINLWLLFLIEKKLHRQKYVHYSSVNYPHIIKINWNCRVSIKYPGMCVDTPRYYNSPRHLKNLFATSDPHLDIIQFHSFWTRSVVRLRGILQMARINKKKRKCF